MKIVFFGSPASALPSLKKILDAGHSVELVVTQPDKPTGRGKKLSPCPVKKMALELGIPVHQPLRIKKDPAVLEKLREIQPEMNVVVAYGQIIPSSIIYFPRHNSWNVHFSLLPLYRGASPVQWALLNGEVKTGVTIIELNEKMDEGDILSQEEADILPEENAAELEARLAQIGAELLIQTIDRIERITPRKQDHSLASYASKLSKDHGRIDWGKNASHIERQIRAFTPWPSTYAFFREKRVKILTGKNTGKQAPPSSFPGEILHIGKDGIQVCCGEESVFLIDGIQPENRNAMEAYAFSLGGRIKSGETFS